jgi:RNA polymerase sigma factor (sigma-70 family)
MKEVPRDPEKPCASVGASCAKPMRYAERFGEGLSRQVERKIVRLCPEGEPVEDCLRVPVVEHSKCIRIGSRTANQHRVGRPWVVPFHAIYFALPNARVTGREHAVTRTGAVLDKGVMRLDRRDSRTDAQLLRASRLDGGAFEALFERHASRLHRWFAREVGDPDAALDLTAETFARALEGAGRFRPMVGESALPWLFGIGSNLLRGYWRDRRVDRTARERLHVQDDLSFADGPESTYRERSDERISSSALREALDDLPEGQRRAVVLRVVRELPYPDVAAELGCSPENARLRVSRALRALRTRTVRST